MGDKVAAGAGIGVGVLLLLGLIAVSGKKVPPVIAGKPALSTQEIETKTQEFWQSMSALEQIVAQHPELSSVKETLLATEARKDAYLAFPVNRKDVPEDASIAAKVLASSALSSCRLYR